KEMEKMDQKTAQLDKKIREMPYKIESSAKYVKSRLKEMTPDEKPFNTVDNKYYYVVWRGDKSEEWKITKFQNNLKSSEGIEIDDLNGYKLQLLFWNYWKKINLNIFKYFFPTAFSHWWYKSKDYINSCYRWNGGEEWSPILAYDNERDVIKFWVWKDFKTWEKAQRGIVTTAAIGLRAFGYWVIW
ncbi:hypothetical protein C6B38_06155, partial [Spiroplasma sp. ChiS]